MGWLQERRISSSDLWIPAVGRVDPALDSKPIPPPCRPDLPSSEMGRRIVDQSDKEEGDDDHIVDDGDWDHTLD